MIQERREIPNRKENEKQLIEINKKIAKKQRLIINGTNADNVELLTD